MSAGIAGKFIGMDTIDQITVHSLTPFLLPVNGTSS